MGTSHRPLLHGEGITPGTSSGPVYNGVKCDVTNDVTWYDLLDAQNVLRDCNEKETVIEALRRIACVLQAQTDSTGGHIDADVNWQLVTKALDAHPDCLSLQQVGLKVLCRRKTEPSKCEYEHRYRFLIQRLTEFKTDPCVQECCLHMLARLLTFDSFSRFLDDNNYLGNILAIVADAVHDLFEYPGVMDAVTIMIEKSLNNKEGLRNNVQVFLLSELGDHLINLIVSHKSGHAVRILHGILHGPTVSCGQEHMEIVNTMVARNLHVALMNVCMQESTRLTIVAPAMNLLFTLISADDKIASKMASEDFIHEGLLGVMDVLRMSDQVQTSGLKIVEKLIPIILDADTDQADKTAHFIVKVVYTAMYIHLEHVAVQVAGCRTLSILLEYYPQAHMWIGDIADQKQEPVQNLVMCAMLSFPKDAEMFVAACEAVFWIAADNNRLCALLMDKNLHIAIIEGLKRHQASPRAVESGCRALRGLCIFLLEHKQTVVGDGVFDVLVRLQKRYETDKNVQIEVLSAIACMADVDAVRYQCLVEDIPSRIISCMTRFPEEGMIQEAGLEAFAVLAGAAGGSDALLKSRALEVTLEALENNMDNMVIVKKGLIVLQLLAYPNMTDTDVVRERIVKVVCDAIETYKHVKSLLKEACVAIQLLAESNMEISKKFIEHDCHQHLFLLLENDLEVDLQVLAGECLHVLSQEHNLKSTMLLSACRLGTLPATECLIELGANVNHGYKTGTPLYLAVQNQHLDIVRVLLRQGVQDLRLPLECSLRQESHVISGCILQRYGYDRSNGYVSWSGLELQRLEKIWIETTFNENLPCCNSGIGKVYIEKIRSGEERRQKRKLEYSKSDSQLRSPHVRLRAKIVCETKTDVAKVQTETVRGPRSSVVVPPTSSFTFPKDITSKKPRAMSLNTNPSQADSPLVIRRETSDPQRIPSTGPRPTCLSIIIGSPNENDLDKDVPVFVMTPTEEEEWKELTISGINVPYHEADPRLQPSPTPLRRNSSGSWGRKGSRSTQPRASTSSDDGIVNPPSRKRHSSVPALVTNLQLPRRMSTGSVNESAPRPDWAPLVWLDVSDNVIDDVTALSCPSMKPYLSNLEQLNVSNNRIGRLPDDMHMNLQRLTLLDLSNNGLAEFPGLIFHCPCLKTVNLSKNNINSIQLTGPCPGENMIEALDMTKNQIHALPDNLGDLLPKLKCLKLSHNRLKRLPEISFNLQELTNLDLSYNEIESMPGDFLINCRKLECLDLSFNNLSELPYEVASELKMLLKVKLRHNKLAEKPPFYVPRFALYLPNLRHLDVSENGLTGLPALDMWTTKTMKDFIASSNKIKQLNLKDAQVWSTLEKLHLASNDIPVLPKEIGRCTGLTSLDISFNKRIKTLPDELGNCKSIYELNHAGLELDINKTVLDSRVKDVIKYLHNRWKKAQNYYRMKLVVVGFGGVGKTTLLKTLMKMKSKKKEDRPTVGVVVKDWVYNMMDNFSEESNTGIFKTGRKVEITLSTWDFAGQEEFYSTHSCYLSNRAVYLVVFDLRYGPSETKKLQSWLVSIRSRAPGCPVIAVGTHLDKLNAESPNTQRILKTIENILVDFNKEPGFPTIQRAFYVDASYDDESMKELRDYIKYTVNHFEIRGRRVMGEKIPSSYVQLADVLSVRASKAEYPVLEQRELQALVKDNHIDLDEEELNQAIRFLHDAGVVLHYDDSSLQLKNYYFIHPGWLCELMARIITVKQINPFITGNGKLGRKEIWHLFRDCKGFPEKLIPQYIKLLEKFEIALPYSENELLIPCRLPLDRPNLSLPQKPKKMRCYCMPFAPIGLISRILARMIALFCSDEGYFARNEKTIVWRKGIFIFWNEDKYILLVYSHGDSRKDTESTKDTINITVPRARKGIRLLCRAVDEIDGLIDEWYPGLTNIDPMKGTPVLDVLAPCTQCKESERHMFQISTLQDRLAESDYILCPVHKGDVLLSELAPDLVLGDLEDTYILDKQEFKFEESPENLIGNGTFGGVYKAEYQGQVVAVKVFREIGDVNSVKMLRQEATILRSLDHPSVLSLKAVGVRPPVIVIEFAPHGTLSTVFKDEADRNKRDTKVLKHRIAMQVAEGLCYLHSMKVVYRDMKPDNILIFSTCVEATVNAKIADYGIARFTAMQGLCAQEGTPGYRAPEMVNNENYSFQADIFSFGLTLYVMLAGKHPFYYMDSSMEMDRAIAMHVPIPLPDTNTSSHDWPDMKLITMHCLNAEPEERPSAACLVEMLKKSEIYGLQRVIPVSRSTTVECLAVEEIHRFGRPDLRVWIASGDQDTFQLSYTDMSDNCSKTKGIHFKHGRILCMEGIGDFKLALGTQLGQVWIIDTLNCRILQHSRQFDDSVLCMCVCRSRCPSATDSSLLVGLANGKMVIFSVENIVKIAKIEPSTVQLGQECEPVLCMTRHGDRIYVTCGVRIFILNIENNFKEEKCIITGDINPSSPPLYTLLVIRGLLVFSRKSSCVIEIWEANHDRPVHTAAMDAMLSISKPEARITSTSSDGRWLWVGTHSGYLALLDTVTWSLLYVTHRYTSAIRSLEHAICNKGTIRHVFTGGMGHTDIFQHGSKGSQHGCVLVWDADLPEYTQLQTEYDRRRSMTADETVLLYSSRHAAIV